VSTAERVRALVEPLLREAGLDLYDLDLNGGVLQVLVDSSGGAGIDEITKVTRQISRALDEHDPIDGHYTLEVGSPGLERPLRTPAHFAGAVGTNVKLKTRPGTEGDRRLEGVVTSADGTTVTLQSYDGATRTVAFEDIERARTTFEWGGAPKPDRKRKP